MSTREGLPSELLDDPLLRHVPVMEGFKVLEPCVLYFKLGQGGMGAVYKGKHLNLEVDVAVKCLKEDLKGDESFVARFRREAKFAAAINHPNLIHVYDVNEKHGVHFLVMEFVRGENCRQRVQRKGPLAETEAAKILLGASAGVAAAHALGIVHRDLKPDNILISQSGEVKVADLGLAKAATSVELAALTQASTIMGTPQYMPPEQMRDTSSVGPAADVWSLGATLYFLLAGEDAIAPGSLENVMTRVCLDPFPDIRVLRKDLSEPLLRILQRCMRKEPGERYQDAGPLARELEQLLAGTAGVPLADGASTGQEDLTLVSPPPARSIARIRLDLKTRVSAPALPRRLGRYVLVGSVLLLGAAALYLARDSLFPADPKTPTNSAALRQNGAEELGGKPPIQAPGTSAPPPEESKVPTLPAEQLTTQPPTIRFLSPAGESLTKEDHVEVRAQIGGGDIDRVTGPGAELLPRSSDGQVIATITLQKEGRNDLVFQAWDKAGQHATGRLAVIRDTVPPVLSLTSPNTQGVLPSGKVRIAGTCVDEHPAVVTVNGSTAVLAGAFFEQDLDFTPGSHEILLEARDAAGNDAQPLRVRLSIGRSPPLGSPTTGTAHDQETGLPVSLQDPATKIQFLLVKPGRFLMGSTSADGRDDELPRHEVVITRPYYLAIHEITNSAWAAFVRDTGFLSEAEEQGFGHSLDRDGRPVRQPGATWRQPLPLSDGKPPEDWPVTMVTWNDAQAFCRHYGYRLPTEAEWEFCCRSGTAGQYWWGDDPRQGAGRVNVFDRTAAATFPTLPGPASMLDDGFAFVAPVGRFAAHPAGGFFDMLGNVWEWCEDAYAVDAYTRPGPAANPLVQTGDTRVYRGGCYLDLLTRDVRCATRRSQPPSYRSCLIGFRVAVTVPDAPPK